MQRSGWNNNLNSDWYSCHKIGDLVRTKDKRLGIIIKEPVDIQGFLFINILLFKSNNIVLFAPYEIEIISNVVDEPSN